MGGDSDRQDIHIKKSPSKMRGRDEPCSYKKEKDRRGDRVSPLGEMKLRFETFNGYPAAELLELPVEVKDVRYPRAGKGR